MTTDSPGIGDQLEQFRGRLTVMMFTHLALVAGVVLFGLVVLVLTGSKMTFDLAFRNPVFIAGGAVAAISISAASALHRVYFRAFGISADVGAAAGKYQVFVLMRAALIEGAALFSAVVTLVTHNVLPACLLALCVGALVVYRPSEQEFSDLLHSAASRPA